jgi:SAM-dependent methyltransferase
MRLASLMPPAHLSARTGGSDAAYHSIGAANAERLRSLLPQGWDWHGKRVLDFGCGTGRTLVHLLPFAEGAELWGCDIDEPSIEWAQANLSPPLHFVSNSELPPVDLPSGQFDLVFAFSVFTHILETWADWLIEMHRLIAAGGYGIFTFLGEGMINELVGRSWDPARIGMLELDAGKPWSVGGPNAIHSDWWLRAHWGRLFEVLEIEPYRDPSATHGIVVLRKDDRPVPDAATLKALEMEDFREIASLQLNIELMKERLAAFWSADAGALRIENDHLRAVLSTKETAIADIRREIDELWRENADGRMESDRLRNELESILRSKSWKLTAPLRALRRVVSRLVDRRRV